jgi:glycosyltransferase involved in cell wall biosynthesis
VELPGQYLVDLEVAKGIWLMASAKTDRGKLSLIIPAYNEEGRIESVLLSYCHALPGQEIVVVCNGCRDKTPSIVRGLRSKYRQIKVLDFKEKRGKGGAIIEGFKAGGGDKIGFIDADESVEPADIKRMSGALSKADGVIASRKLKSSRILVQQPWKRRVASKVFNALVRAIFGLNFKDTQCGAKIFKKKALNSVLGKLKTRGFEFDVELLWKLQNKGYKIIEFPITWKHSEGTTFSLWSAPGMFFSLLKVRLWK